MVFPDRSPIMSDLMEWISNVDEGGFNSIFCYSGKLICCVISVSAELQDLHVKLLRKLKRSVNPEKWEKAIIKFCYFYGGSDDGNEINQLKSGEINLLQF